MAFDESKKKYLLSRFDYWYFRILNTIVAISMGLKINDTIMSYTKFRALPREQQEIVEKIKQERISDKELKKNMKYFASANQCLKDAKKAANKGDASAVLDNIINAKGYLEKINPKIFDTREIRVQIEDVRTKQLLPLLQK